MQGIGSRGVEGGRGHLSRCYGLGAEVRQSSISNKRLLDSMWPCSGPLRAIARGPSKCTARPSTKPSPRWRGHPDDPDAWASVGGVRTHLGLDLWVRGSLTDGGVINSASLPRTFGGPWFWGRII